MSWIVGKLFGPGLHGIVIALLVGGIGGLIAVAVSERIIEKYVDWRARKTMRDILVQDERYRQIVQNLQRLQEKRT